MFFKCFYSTHLVYESNGSRQNCLNALYVALNNRKLDFITKYLYVCIVWSAVKIYNMLFSSLKDHVKAIMHTSAVKHGPDNNMHLKN